MSYHRNGYEVIDDWASAEEVEYLLGASKEWTNVHVKPRAKPLRPGDGCGEYRYEIADGGPETWLFYERARLTAQGLTGREVQVSPDEFSDVVYKRYPPETGQQGWHYDTNSLTALLYLTTSADGGCTRLKGHDGSTVDIQPKAGRLLFMEGCRVWHCALPAGSTSKQILLFNLYWLGRFNRPAHTDQLIRGQVSIG